MVDIKKLKHGVLIWDEEWRHEGKWYQHEVIAVERAKGYVKKGTRAIAVKIIWEVE